MPSHNNDDLYTFPAGCNIDRVVVEAKKIMVAARTTQAIKESLSDCCYKLLQNKVEDALKALKERNESPAGQMIIAEVMAYIPLIRRLIKWRLSEGKIKSNKALDELLDALTDRELAAFFTARTTSFGFFVVTTPAELKAFLDRHPELDACEMQVHGSYLLISFRNNETGQEIMVWYAGAAPMQTLAQRQQQHLRKFRGLDEQIGENDGAVVTRQRNVFHEDTLAHCHVGLTTTDGPLGAVGWLGTLCHGITGKLLPGFSDGQLRVLFVSFDEIMAAALFGTVFGGFPNASLLYGACLRRLIEPGNTHIPFLSDFAESTVEEQHILKKRRIAASSSTSASASEGSADQSPPTKTTTKKTKKKTTKKTTKTMETTTETASRSAAAAQTTMAAASQSTSSNAVRKRWASFVDSAAEQPDDNEEFSVVSAVRVDEADDARTVKIATSLTTSERSRAAHLATASSSQGLPASVTGGCTLVKLGSQTFTLDQDFLVKNDGAGSSRSTGAFSNGTMVSLKVRSHPDGFVCLSIGGVIDCFVVPQQVLARRVRPGQPLQLVPPGERHRRA